MDYDITQKFLQDNPDAFLSGLNGVLLKMTPEDELMRTGPCWTTIYTGLSFENHCIMEAWGEPAKFREFKHPCIWDVLNKHGVTTGLFGLPVTYPPKSIDGFWVSGFPTPPPRTEYNPDGAVISFPASIQFTHLRQHVVDIIQVMLNENNVIEDWGYPEPSGKIKADWQSGFYEKMRKDENYPYKICVAVYRRQLRAIKGLFRDYHVDAMFIQFSFLDHVGHLEYTLSSLFPEKMYLLVDSIIKELYLHFNPDNFVIVSDHGFKDKRHAREAVAYFQGEDINTDYMKNFSNMDVMPTVLFMMGVPSPPVDGIVHYGLFKSQYLSEEDEKHINEKLRVLGYIE